MEPATDTDVLKELDFKPEQPCTSEHCAEPARPAAWIGTIVHETGNICRGFLRCTACKVRSEDLKKSYDVMAARYGATPIQQCLDHGFNCHHDWSPL